MKPTSTPTTLPSTTLPSTTLPSTTLPSTTLPSTTLTPTNLLDLLSTLSQDDKDKLGLILNPPTSKPKGTSINDTYGDLLPSTPTTPLTPRILRGKSAITGAPTNENLPPIKPKSTDKTGDIFDKFIFDLITSGYTEEERTIGTLYDRLVHTNFISIPQNPLIRP